MTKWNPSDLQAVEKSPSSPAFIQWKLGEVIYNSTTCKCKVESVNPTTGEYRIVLSGTLHNEDTPTPRFN